MKLMVMLSYLLDLVRSFEPVPQASIKSPCFETAPLETCSNGETTSFTSYFLLFLFLLFFYSALVKCDHNLTLSFFNFFF